jgi:hypothetical protein
MMKRQKFSWTANSYLKILVYQALFFCLTMSAEASAQQRNVFSIKPAGNSQAASFLVQKFSEYDIIALDEGPHGTLQNHKFIRQLFGNNKFNHTVQYVIFEFLNQDYQNTIDSYIDGRNVSLTDLRLSWRNSTQAHSTNFEKPVYSKLLATIRLINLTLPKSKKIRVLAGDPSINWGKINSINDYFRAISQRDVLPAKLAIRYGIDSSKKVLLIYGGEHLTKISDEKQDSTFWTITFHINKRYPGTIYTIGAHNSENYPNKRINYPLNSIINLSDNPLGSLQIKDLSDTSKTFRLGNLYDAVYYVGSSGKNQADVPLPINSTFWEELNRRSKIVWGQGIDPKLRIKN